MNICPRLYFAPFLGGLAQLGWFFILSLIIFVRIGAPPQGVLATLFVTRQSSEVVPGIITDIKKSGASTKSAGGTKSSYRKLNRVDKYYYSFSVEFDVQAYGKSVGPPGKHEVGDSVSILYLRKHPEYSKVDGLYPAVTTTFYEWILYLLVYPGIIYIICCKRRLVDGIKELLAVHYGDGIVADFRDLKRIRSGGRYKDEVTYVYRNHDLATLTRVIVIPRNSKKPPPTRILIYRTRDGRREADTYMLQALTRRDIDHLFTLRPIYVASIFMPAIAILLHVQYMCEIIVKWGIIALGG